MGGLGAVNVALGGIGMHYLGYLGAFLLGGGIVALLMIWLSGSESEMRAKTKT